MITNKNNLVLTIGELSSVKYKNLTSLTHSNHDIEDQKVYLSSCKIRQGSMEDQSDIRKQERDKYSLTETNKQKYKISNATKLAKVQRSKIAGPIFLKLSDLG